MKSSDKLIEALKGFEGFSAKPYRDSVGVWTQGWGHTRGVTAKSKEVTEEQAEKWLRQDLKDAEDRINNLAIAKTQGQFDALVDFVYNLGINAFLSSTLIKCIRRGGGKFEIQYQFKRWCYAGGVKLGGLVKRRAWEAERYYE